MQSSKRVDAKEMASPEGEAICQQFDGLTSRRDRLFRGVHAVPALPD